MYIENPEPLTRYNSNLIQLLAALSQTAVVATCIHLHIYYLVDVVLNGGLQHRVETTDSRGISVTYRKTITRHLPTEQAVDYRKLCKHFFEFLRKCLPGNIWI